MNNDIAIPEEIVNEAVKRFSRKFMFVYPEKYYTADDMITGARNPSGKRHYGICTACGKRSENVPAAQDEYKKWNLRKPYHDPYCRPTHGYVLCPQCEELVEARKGTLDKKCLKDGHYIRAWDAESPDKVILYEFCLIMADWTDHAPQKIAVQYQRKTELSPGKAETFEYWYQDWNANVKSWEKINFPREAREPLPKHWNTLGEEKLAGTFLENIYNYCEEHHLSIRYIMRFVEEPLTELFYKMGFEGVANDRVWKDKATKGTRHIDFTQRSPKKMFRGLTKAEEQKAKQVLLQVKNKNMLWCHDFERAISMIKKCKCVSIDTIVSLLDGINDYRHDTDNRVIMEICAKVPSFPAERIIDYIHDHDLPIYRDYIKFAVKNGAPINEQHTAFPEDLLAAHDKQIEDHEFLIKRESFEKCKKRKKQLENKGYSYEHAGIISVIPEKPTDIRREGQYLHHCVGNYAEDHVSGKTNIIFIRRAESPTIPWYTLEVAPDTLGFRQCYGFKNQTRGKDDPEVKKFLNAYKRHLETYKHKNKKQEDKKCRKTA